MKNIMVIALGHLSNGEITIALETLKHIHGKDYRLLFISHDWGVKYISSFNIPVKSLKSADPKENLKEFQGVFKEFETDLIVCADVYTMDYAGTWSGITFPYLKSLGVPIGSFDQYEWESTDFKWDFMQAKPTTIKPSLIKDCDFLIRPCPLNKPAPFDSRVLTCPLFGKNPTPPTGTREQWSEALGIPAGQKTVFTVNSGWEYVDVTKFIELAALMQWMPKIIYNHLLSVKEPLTVIHVGPRPWNFPIHERITYRHFNRMDAGLYQETEKYADLFCGTNAISITMTKAIYSMTPCVLFQNLKVVDFEVLKEILPKMPAWYRDMAGVIKKSPTFRIFPWGWKNFLEPVLKDNLYTRTFVEAPIFMAPRCTKILKQYLFDQEAISQLQVRQKEFFNSLNGLSPIEELLERI